MDISNPEVVFNIITTLLILGVLLWIAYKINLLFKSNDQDYIDFILEDQYFYLLSIEPMEEKQWLTFHYIHYGDHIVFPISRDVLHDNETLAFLLNEDDLIIRRELNKEELDAIDDLFCSILPEFYDSEMFSNDFYDPYF